MTPAIFLSYSSDDADAARRICDALRAAGLEVWFDQSELRGGDAWDASIRKQIKECALFIPIISANTNAREEGYFRLEWKLAVDRSHLMADNKAFFVPVLIGDVNEPTALVPDKFRERQWSRLNDVAAIAEFAARVVKLLAGSGVSGPNAPDAAPVLGLGAMDTTPATLGDTTSIAVLAFANRSASADDEYFSDGLADELLNVLARIKGLRVAARTSAFSFKGKAATIAEIGRSLNVATVLEGSVRKSGNRVRISVQLVKVADGYQLWSETYDRTLDDIFAVQDDIAQAVVTELRSALMGEETDANSMRTVKAEIASASAGRSEDAEAHRLLLQARFLLDRHSGAELSQGITYLREAVAIDPEYALAWALLSRALTHAAGYGVGPVIETNTEALACAQRALQLAPDMVDAQLAMCLHLMFFAWDFRRAELSLERTLAIAPENAETLSVAAVFYYVDGRLEQALEFGHRALARDPLNSRFYMELGRTEIAASRFAEAETTLRRALEISPDGVPYRYLLAESLALQGRFDEALAEVAKDKSHWARMCGLATNHFRVGNLAESDRALDELIEQDAHHAATQIAMAYAVRGDSDAAFHWLERSYAQRDSGVLISKVEASFKPIHMDPRWGAFLRKMRLED